MVATESSDELALSWTASTETPLATGYDVEWGTGGSYLLGSVSVTTTSYTITGLMDGTAYNVRVRATITNAESGWISGTFTTTSPPPFVWIPRTLTRVPNDFSGLRAVQLRAYGSLYDRCKRSLELPVNTDPSC